LYGVLSFSVARRRAEFGIRIALGSPRARVAWAVIRGVLVQVGVGIGVGLPAALAAARTAGGLLFGVSPTAADVYLISAILLIAIACVAAWIPAWRACSIDPSEVLRCE
jgi:putative ABC transport system permease protein